MMQHCGYRVSGIVQRAHQKGACQAWFTSVQRRGFVSSPKQAYKYEYLVQIPDKPNALQKRLAVRPTHLKDLQPKIDRGQVVFGGAKLSAQPETDETPQMIGSVMLFKADSEEEVWEMLREDPYTKGGAWDVEKAVITPFRANPASKGRSETGVQIAHVSEALSTSSPNSSRKSSTPWLRNPFRPPLRSDNLPIDHVQRQHTMTAIAASPSDHSPGLGGDDFQNGSAAGDKRKAEDSGSAHGHTRSKRSRYISIACNECKRRKIKCNGQTPCQRCGNLSLECVYAPNCCTNSLKDSQEFKQMQDQVQTLLDQVNELWAVINELRGQNQPYAPSEPFYAHHEPPRSVSMTMSRTLPPLIAHKKQPQPKLPQFHGPTSSVYGFDVAKSSLQTMGITQPPEEMTISRDRSQAASPVQLAPHPSKDPIWLLEHGDALRLVNIWDEECHIMYPVLDMEKLVKHLNLLYNFISSALRTGFGQPGLPGEDAFDDEMTTVLKLVLACALIIEGHGQSDLGQRLYDSAKRAVDMVIVGTLSLKAVVLIILTAIFHFQKDEETQAWRFIGIAGRMCIEMGLHRKASLLKLFPSSQDLRQAVRVFWVVYALDRRWSFGTGMPFALQDADIDPHLPEPDVTFPYLKYITIYNHIATKIWSHNTSYDANGMANNGRRDDIGYLDFQILQWYENLPEILKFNSNALEQENEVPDRKARRLRFLMFLRKNQARTSIYRPILHSATSIMQNRHHADTVIAIAKDTINTIINVDRTSDIYRTQQVCYNYFLVQALAVIFLSVAHAPALFCDPTRSEFYGAIDLIKGFSTKSHTTRRLWKTIRGLKDLGHKIGQLARQGQAQQQQKSPASDTDREAQNNAALTMAGLAGHKLDNGNTYRIPTPIRPGSVEIGYSPENASQMGNELTALFEMAGAMGGTTPGVDSYGGPPYGQHQSADTDDGSFNVMFGNEPEFSRIMNELL